MAQLTFPARGLYVITFSVPDDPLTVGTGTTPFVVPSALAGGRVVAALAAVAVAPTGASLIADVNLDGTTIFTAQGNRPTITASSTVSTETVPDVATMTALGKVTVDRDQVGSTVAGGKLVVEIVVELR